MIHDKICLELFAQKLRVWVCKLSTWSQYWEFPCQMTSPDPACLPVCRASLWQIPSSLVVDLVIAASSPEDLSSCNSWLRLSRNLQLGGRGERGARGQGEVYVQGGSRSRWPWNICTIQATFCNADAVERAATERGHFDTYDLYKTIAKYNNINTSQNIYSQKTIAKYITTYIAMTMLQKHLNILHATCKDKDLWNVSTKQWRAT